MIVNAEGNKVEQVKTYTAEELLEKHIAHISCVIPDRYIATVILRDREEKKHVLYTQDPLADVAQCVAELREMYPDAPTAH